MNRIVALASLTVGMLFLFSAIPACAALWSFDPISLDGLQEVPENASPGTGSATALLNDLTGEITLSGTFQDLLGTTTNAHLHGLADPGVNAGVLFGLSFDSGVTSGSFSGASTLSELNVQGVKDGKSYINIHSSAFPGGELRGQLINPLLVPEPCTTAMAFVASLFFGVRRRRERVEACKFDARTNVL